MNLEEAAELRAAPAAGFEVPETVEDEFDVEGVVVKGDEPLVAVVGEEVLVVDGVVVLVALEAVAVALSVVGVSEAGLVVLVVVVALLLLEPDESELPKQLD